MGAVVTRVVVNLLWLVPGVVGGSEESTTDALRAVADLIASDRSGGDLDVHLGMQAREREEARQDDAGGFGHKR